MDQHAPSRAGGISRRQFLQTTAMATLIGAHGVDGVHGEAARDAAGSPIAELHLESAASAAEMEQFYGTLLGLPVARETGDRVAVQAGDSRLVFTSRAAAGRPFYHFAFNIPENKIVLARSWQVARTPLLPIPARLRAPDYPADVVDYRHWNAHSIFFLDPAGNVVEYIARHDLRNHRPGGFTPGDILCASEIGLVVDDVAETARLLREALGMRTYRGESDAFAAIGDERGLLLVFRRGRILNFQPDSQEKAATVYPTGVVIRGGPASGMRLTGYPYELRAGS